MQFFRKHLLSFLLLSMLALSTGVLAMEDVDCINYSDSPDVRCKYYRIWDVRGAQLYIVPGNILRKEYAIKGASFYVYAPQEQQIGHDTLTLKLIPEWIDIADLSDSIANLGDWSDVVNFMGVKASADSGLVNVAISSRYELFNFQLGTSEDEDGNDVIVSLIYNFYVPELKYYDEDGKEITKDTKISLEVGDTMKVRVEAIIPIGKSKGNVDSDFNKTFYIDPMGQSASINYLSVGGKSLKLDNGKIALDVKKGEATFLMVATEAVTDGSTFTLNAFEDGTTDDGKTNFILTDKFPGSYQFTNPDMPTMDGAAIYDTDGDGVGDSIAVWFGGNMDSVDVEKFYYSWPSDNSFETYGGDVKQKSNDVFGLPDVEVELQGDSATGAVKAYVCSSVGNRCDTLKTSLVDSIGAAIQSATLLEGTDKDVLIIRFNKDMDTTWTSGQGFIVNDKTIDATAISKDGNVWKFEVEKGTVNVGEMIKIETNTDKVLTAADGVPTNKNNQKVPVQSAGRVFVNNDNNGFYDRDGDGRMDSTSIGFDEPITEDNLKNLDITFYWLDSDGELISIPASSLNPTISDDGLVLGFSIDDPDAFDIMEMLTGIDPRYSKDGETEYGYAIVKNKITIDGKDSVEGDGVPYGMNDYMAPVISSTFLTPESFQVMEPDKFKIVFSEAIDYKDLELSDDCLEFYVDGEWVRYNLSSAEWSADGRAVILYMEAGEDLSTRMNPADSVRFGNFTNGLKDSEGNVVSENSPAVMVEGDPRVIMKTTSFADLNRVEELSEREKPFTLKTVESAQDAFDQASLGVLMDIGYSTIMKTDSSGTATPDMHDIGLSWELYVYTNLGGYVGGASGKISCDDPAIFNGGNCLENPDKLYVRWNMRAENGRRVGVGIYLAKFKVKVYGAKEDFKIERIFRWGISAKKSK